MSEMHLPANVHEAWLAAGWAIVDAAISHQRPSVLYRPQLCQDGNQWCALYGENLMEGVAGFGDTPKDAMEAFDAAWDGKDGS